MTLLEECIDTLKKNVRILNKEEQTKAFNSFLDNLPVTLWGRIDWDKIDNHKVIDDEKDILTYVDSNDRCIIIWNEMFLPIIETYIGQFLENIDDVLAVGFDTWVVVESKNIIIEFYHDGEMTLFKRV